jgi:hypothetical protein
MQALTKFAAAPRLNVVLDIKIFRASIWFKLVRNRALNENT